MAVRFVQLPPVNHDRCIVSAKAARVAILRAAPGGGWFAFDRADDAVGQPTPQLKQVA